MKFYTQYSNEHNDPVVKETEPSLTDQQYKQQCDVNFIVEQYVRVGQPIPVSNMSYADLTSASDYQDSLLKVSECNSAFELLPAKDRERFENKVENYLEFISKSENLKESYEKGYIDPGSVSQDIIDSFYNQPVVAVDDVVKPTQTSSPASDVSTD